MSAFSDQFDQFSDREQRQLAADIANYYTGAKDRHQELLDLGQTFIGALAAGARAFADALERPARRR